MKDTRRPSSIYGLVKALSPRCQMSEEGICSSFSDESVESLDYNESDFYTEESDEEGRIVLVPRKQQET